ncbi:GerAB/ArcD/ProY family transporter [Salirhabdus sp. Marseille-P4669]|uniref:GerAB/ArcD/ProY family transporter n=1 Tax=Salirhabdus sp. Marseille-P4669 TaxID=2042310 RepID=UPI000C7BD967|nr:endospore germination permease [Salirhabdus sp. Marseille-P4669]
MRFQKQITAAQVMMIIANTTIGVSVLALPRIATEKVNTGGFFITFIGLVIAFIGCIIIAALGVRFPKKTFIEYSSALISKPISMAIGMLLIVYFILLEGFILREFGEVMNHSLLDKTPIFVTITSMIIVIAITSRNSITTFAHIQYYYFPFIVIPIFLMVLISFSKMEIVHLKPFLGNNANVSNYLRGVHSVIGLPFIQIGTFILTIIIPYTKSKKHTVIGSILGILVSGITILFAVGVTMAVFGAEEIKKSLWPMFVLARMIQFPAEMLERVDIVFIVVWIFSAFTTLLSGYVLIAYISGKVFGFNDHLPFTIILLPIVILVALYPDNIQQLYDYMEWVGKGGILLTFLYPLILLVLSLARKKRGDHH